MPKVVGKKINVARKKVSAAGCKFKVVYKKSKRPKNIVIAQSRKANKKLVYRAVVKLTVSTKQVPKKKSKATEDDGQGEVHRQGLHRHELAPESGAGSRPAACTVRKTVQEAP